MMYYAQSSVMIAKLLHTYLVYSQPSLQLNLVHLISLLHNLKNCRLFNFHVTALALIMWNSSKCIIHSTVLFHVEWTFI